MFGPRIGSLRKLVSGQHEETMTYLRQRQEESKRRDEESKRRDEEFKRRDEEFKQQAEETREFNREILLRNEKVYTALIAEVEEGRKQIQANTRAVLSVLDRLEGSGGIAA
jgi:hypothetical protein